MSRAKNPEVIKPMTDTVTAHHSIDLIPFFIKTITQGNRNAKLSFVLYLTRFVQCRNNTNELKQLDKVDYFIWLYNEHENVKYLLNLSNGRKHPGSGSPN